MTLRIVRSYTPQGTPGELYINDVLTCYTLELPDKQNQSSISCIPEGSYPIERKRSPSRGQCLWIRNVPNRQHILIHAGNTLKDTRGCILVGMLQNPEKLTLKYSIRALELVLDRVRSSSTLQITSG